MDPHQSKLKKTAMMYLWRVQQSQAVISIIFWGLTITGIFYPYFQVKFKNFGLPESWTFGGMLIIFMCVMLGVVAFGIIYDKLKFWKEQTIVVAERNPYASWKLMPMHLFWMDLWVATAKAQPNRTPELEKAIAFAESWMKRCEDTDPWTKEMRSIIVDFALKGDVTQIDMLNTRADE
jgi:hypothetical protein